MSAPAHAPFIAGAAPRRARGLTLIELMISMTIGLIILSALTYIYVGSRGTYRVNENLARVQETGRFALDYIGTDLRMTSYAGCRSRSLTVDDGTLFNATQPAVTFNGAGDGIVGYEDGSGWTNPTSVTRVAGDVLTIRRAGGMSVRLTANSDPVARTMTLEHNAVGLRNGDIAVLANCERALMFRVTNNPATTGIGNFPTVIEYQTSGAGPGGTEGNVAVIPADVFTPESRATVMRFTETHYFVGNNPSGLPALFRASGGTVEELVDGVEDIDIVYGVDTSLPEPDGIADNYVRADAVANWAQVVSVRISVLAVGTDGNVTTNAQTYTFRDTTGDGVADTQTAPDRRLRQVFSSTIALRNRVL